MNKKSIASLIIVFLLGLALGFLADVAKKVDTGNALIPTNSYQANANTSIMIDYGDGAIAVYQNKILRSQETLADFMKEVFEKNKVPLEYKEFSGLGILIEKIGDKKNGEDNKYWQYWINNDYAKVGASSYIIKPRDVIEWKFVKQQI